MITIFVIWTPNLFYMFKHHIYSFLLFFWKRKYKRIIIQDSTIINLPQRLFSIFSGISNGHVQVANARIQIALDILANIFIHFSLDSYSTNDIKAANQLPIQQGDLIIRDRGYFSIAEIKRIIKEAAHFIYRYKHGINYCDVNTGVPINLLKKLSKKKLQISGSSSGVWMALL